MMYGELILAGNASSLKHYRARRYTKAFVRQRADNDYGGRLHYFGKVPIISRMTCMATPYFYVIVECHVEAANLP